MPLASVITGQREMTGLGIYHYGARFRAAPPKRSGVGYSPKLGRFLSADTIVPGAANPQAFNRYSYVLGNPLKYIDPTGHYCVGDDEDCADEAGDGPAPTGTGGNNGGGGNGGGGGGGGGGGHHDDPPDQNPNCFACSIPIPVPEHLPPPTDLHMGEPQDLGDYISGISVSGGQPNSFHVHGCTVEKVGDRLTCGAAGAGLGYNATYGIEFYENGAILFINEYYTLNENTFYTSVDTAASVLTVNTSDGTSYHTGLTEFNVAQGQVSTNAITIYGSYPNEMNITIYIILEETIVFSAPLPVFEFDTDPIDVAP